MKYQVEYTEGGLNAIKDFETLEEAEQFLNSLNDSEARIVLI